MIRNRFRPRFSLRTLATFVTLFGCAFWWLIWPAKVANCVADLLNERKYHELSVISATENDRDFVNYLTYISNKAASPAEETFFATPRKRTWSEIFRGRHQFILGFHFEIVVERGAVSFVGSDEIDYGDVLEQQERHDELEKKVRESHPEWFQS